ncbi:NADPH cytochrome P450 oxidoreductase family protein [Microbulbifer celer]|uniref:NADPH--hemoprotein reductase n=1 Tax=Microbulbifer celer TaxID=435905 RepID=A0ABW3UAU6_9GAMM|nr:NADPH cytochrome P450 oxidoreductase family protein [Microbulbifer celer]UFN59172.1 flavodoxin domain-containing protein [Microbulbifer celer]
MAVALVMAWLLWCVWLYWRARRAQPCANRGGHTLVAYASQSGTAAALAARRARQLEVEAGEASVNLLPLNQVSRQTLLAARKAVFVVSTYGEGEPPDNGVRFARQFLRPALHAGGAEAGGQINPALDLSHLSYSVVALGDSAYAQFCAFGRRLFEGMAAMGAQALAPLEQIDSGQIAAVPDDGSEGGEAGNRFWTLTARTLLNPGSPGAPLYEVTLSACGPLPTWRAGDIFVLQPRNAPEVVSAWLSARNLDGDLWISSQQSTRQLRDWLSERDLSTVAVESSELLRGDFSALPMLPAREYSVASVPREGNLKLIVRQQMQTDGGLGVGSGWLTAFSEPGARFAGRLRHNNNCHTIDHTPPMLAIGAGSGLAGLRAQLAERSGCASAGPAWVVFGERSETADCPLALELDNWLTGGVIARCDRVFSRGEVTGKRYVQDVLTGRADDVQAFVARGADIYVCGSRSGMGESVHRALAAILGEQALEALMAEGRYRRDLY